MEKTRPYETFSPRAYAASFDNYTVIAIRYKNEFECYLKKHIGASDTPFMFMYSVPVDQDPISTVIDTAVVNAEDYDFLFEDQHWMTPCSVPVFHPNLLLHQCSDCGNTIDAGSKFCPECGHKISWESVRTED